MSASSSNEIIPWEPYKAAVNTKKKFKMKDLQPGDLIKYKTDTDLDEFNRKRPGHQFDDFDFKSIESPSFQQSMDSVLSKHDFKRSLSTNLAKHFSQDGKEGPNFIDARFYTDTNFMKLANQLKKKSMTKIENKPVNIVGPMIDKKITDPFKADLDSSRIWKNQCENYQSRIDYLEEQIKGINEQLQVQTEVNAELKKLLVAAIGGEDMQYKIERLVSDKQRFEIELKSKTNFIDKLEEEVEQVSIQCDLWRSKFLASKLLAEENSTWKSFLLMLNAQKEKTIQNLLEDNEVLNLKLNQTLDILSKKQNRHNMNNLQAVNTILSNLFKSNPKLGLDAINLNHGSQIQKKKSKTINEIGAEQALEQFNWVKKAVISNNIESNSVDMVDKLDNLEILIKKIKENRKTKFSRLYQPQGADSELFLNVCVNCKGSVKII
ncbi:golgin-45 [Brachionus plicatilis]|uniref:Golgin-45 n=1 Tax=Brachionus plicatilis TaxID=10195 RepID=A0A3M7R023_BRAPC|nr:golgin-45 [Brachionus plicatilis]